MTIYNDTLTEALDTSTIDSGEVIFKDILTESIDFSSTSIYTAYTLITDSIEMQGYADPSLPYYPVTSGISFSDSTSITRGILVLENLLITGNGIHSITTSDAILEYIELLESIVLSFNKTVSETLSISSAVTIITNNTNIVVEELIVNSSVSSLVEFLNTLIETVSILDTVLFGYKFTVSESLSINSASSELYKAILTISEALGLTETNTNSYIHIVSLDSTLNLSSILDSNVNLSEVLIDNIVITIPTSSGQETYLGYVFSPEGNSVTTYTNYNFDGNAKYKGKYYFFNSTGLYLYGGVTDDGDLIRSVILTSANSFGTSNKKQIPQIYLGATNSDELMMKVRVDGKAECHYRLRKHTNELDTQKIKIGKGLIGRYFQFELITEAEEFSMESIEFFPIVLKRKL